MTRHAPSIGGIPTARSVDHIGMTVPDLAEAVEFFTTFLGCELIWEHGPYGNDGQTMLRQLNVDPRSTARIAFLRMGPTFNLELFEYSSPEQRQDLPCNSDIGGNHIGIYVDDIVAAVDYLKSIPGVKVQEGPNYNTGDTDPSGQSFCYFQTPWGYQMEVISFPEGMGYQKRTKKRTAPPAEYWHNGPQDSNEA